MRKIIFLKRSARRAGRRRVIYDTEEGG